MWMMNISIYPVVWQLEGIWKTSCPSEASQKQSKQNKTLRHLAYQFDLTLHSFININIVKVKASSGMYTTCIHLLLVKNICLDLSLSRLPQKSSLKMSKLFFFLSWNLSILPSLHFSISPSDLYPTTHHPSISITYALDICWVPNSVVGVKIPW